MLTGPADLLQLAPERLPNLRPARYEGDQVSSAVSEFVPEDQRVLHRVYGTLQALLEFVRSPAADDPVALEAETQRLGVAELIPQIRKFGEASYRKHPARRLAQTIHDVRGGALTPLVGHLQSSRIHQPGFAGRVLHSLIRDHLKIMLNAVVGLDEDARASRFCRKAHLVDQLVDKWQHAHIGDANPDVTVHVDCQYRGTISESCMESAALDRVLYNFLHNAARHSASKQIDLVMFPVPAAAPADLRFVAINPVGDESLAALHEFESGGGLRRLFEPGVSTTGSGMGLAIAAEFIANAYGLESGGQAVEGGYLGAKLLGRDFHAWAHWPLSGAA